VAKVYVSERWSRSRVNVAGAALSNLGQAAGGAVRWQPGLRLPMQAFPEWGLFTTEFTDTRVTS